MNIEALSLNQLRVILCVADEGGLSAAARRVRRTQSAVSYAVAQAEAQLGVALFDRTGRRACLTETGAALLPEMRAIVGRVDGLRARAAAAAQGVETALTLVADAVFDPAVLAGALRDVQKRFPAVAVRVHIETLGAVIDRTQESRGALGLIATMLDLPDGLARIALSPLPMVWVAAPGHPLADCAPAEQVQTLRDAVQIVLADRSPRTAGRDYAVLSARTWRVDDLALKHALIRAGAGWGSLPLWMVAGDIAAGRLRRLSGGALAQTDDMAAQAFYDAGHQPGPVMRMLIDRLCGGATAPAAAPMADVTGP